MRRALLVLALMGAAACARGQVALRGGESAPAGLVVARADEAGVWLAQPVGNGVGRPTMVAGWDRIKSVAGEGEEEAKQFAEVAELLWRARTRLERGDFVAAEPLLERLFERYRGKTGPTAAVVAEGLLRCRIRRAAHVAAVDPWLALLASKQGEQTAWLHPEWASQAGLGSVVDEKTGLAPALPPIWLNWPSVGAWAAAGPRAQLADERAAQLAGLYRISAEYETGSAVAVPAWTGGDAGVRIVWEIVASRAGDAAQRSSARERLRERLRPPAAGVEPAPAWLEAWVRAALGRSLVLEADPEQRRLGVIELLHVPARFARTHPYLAGIALAEASSTLRAIGDEAGADVLARELELLYPTHPVRDWNSGGAPAKARVLPGGG